MAAVKESLNSLKKHSTSPSRSNLEYKLQDKHIFEACHTVTPTSASRSNLEYKLQEKHIFEACHVLEHLHLPQGQVQINFTVTQQTLDRI